MRPVSPAVSTVERSWGFSRGARRVLLVVQLVLRAQTLQEHLHSFSDLQIICHVGFKSASSVLKIFFGEEV